VHLLTNLLSGNQHALIFWTWCIITSPTKGDRKICFRLHRYVSRYIGIYVCEQLAGANSSPIVTKLCQSYPWPHGIW